MAESNLTWESDNCFVPNFIPVNLKWYERDGFYTWDLKYKRDKFIKNTDLDFSQLKIVNFDMINNPNQKRKILKNIKRLTMKKYKSTLLNIEIKSIRQYFGT